MANKLDNLMSVEELNSRRTPEQHSEDSRKAGIASGEARRQKATMKKVLQEMLEEVANVKGNRNNLTYKQLATLGLIKGAINGNANNYKTILEAIGELSIQAETKEPVININMVNNENLEKDFFDKEE